MRNTINQMLANNSSFKLLSYLSQTTSSCSGRELAKRTGLSHQTVHQMLQKMAELGIITIEKVGTSYVYQLNSDHLFVQKVLKPALHLTADWPEIIGEYYQESLKPKPISIILFGSVAREEANPESDLDLLFIYNDLDFSMDNLESINALSEKVYKMCHYHPTPHLVSWSDFKTQAKRGEGLMRTVVREGQIIGGKLLSELITNDAKKN